ncbi:MAG: GNAT family N-acetyltransferase [bacterium]|nr:GNAT family N-acetyltransferase [bacterium]
MIIKEATKKDLPSIMGLIRSERADGRKISYNQFLIAKDKNEIIGCIRIKEMKDCLELGSLVVSPEHRDKGIGSRLIKNILVKDRRRPIYLLCFAKMASFYSKAGFNKISVNFLPKTFKDEYLLVKGKLKKFHRKIVVMAIN